MTYRLFLGSARSVPIADESVQCVVTSPPYWGLRQYAGEQRETWGGDPEHAHEWGILGRAHRPGQVPDGKHQHEEAVASGQNAGSGQFCACGAWYGALGLEPTPEMYVEHIVAIFREVRRVLRKDGTLWLNLGDSYAASPGQRKDTDAAGAKQQSKRGSTSVGSHDIIGLPAKNLVGVPWRVAFALQADGWILRSDIIWAKPNAMPESVTDRPTKAHEYLFLLSKSQTYYYDADAIREPAGEFHAAGKNNRADVDRDVSHGTRKQDALGKNTYTGFNDRWRDKQVDGRNKRTVWTIATQPYAGAHFATFPEALVEPCILAGSAPGDVVLDPFCGSGTTGQVARFVGRDFIGVDQSEAYLTLAVARIDSPTRTEKAVKKKVRG